MDVRTRILMIRILEKMKEPSLKEYGDRIGIIDNSNIDGNLKYCEKRKSQADLEMSMI